MNNEEKSPQPPAPSCGKCSWTWSKSRGEWVPSWDSTCTEHKKPSDLL